MVRFGIPIIKEHVRVLRPDEYVALRSGAPKEAKRADLDGLLYGGLRYVEAQRFKEHPEWLDPKGFIHLPEEAVLKSKRRQLQRWVRLNPRGLEAMGKFLRTPRLPTTQAWGQDLRRWAKTAGLDPVGLGPKTTRKTWESWLVYCYPEQQTYITLSQGHTSTTSVSHYLNMPFVGEDRERMRPFLEGYFSA